MRHAQTRLQTRIQPRAAATGAATAARAAAANRRRRAFTLVELVIVIAILGTLMVVLTGSLTDLFESSKEKAEGLKIQNLRTTLIRYNADVGNYPTSEEGLQALVTAPANSTGAVRWKGPYLTGEDAELRDSWGNPYKYARPGTRGGKPYDLWSLGPDGQDGTADDIGNWVKSAANTPK
ncbi:MAG: type II secretion system major pseudopilin GspG [Puniceicoccales bacterium]|jgi:general secretion pathway protein G|nr:type II secretion system major pseudopilin GspG [Puniceicoccales bacterium]